MATVIRFTEPYVATSKFYNGVPVDRTATGSGLGTQTSTGLHVSLRTATGSGTGTQTAVGARVKQVTATGSGAGTTNGGATKLHISPRTATGSGTGTQTGIGARLNAKTASGFGTGTNNGGASRLITRYRSGSTSAGTGSSSSFKIIIGIRYATGSGAGSQTSIGLHVSPRTATGSGVGSQSVISFSTRFRTATGSGSSSQASNGLHTSPRNATGSGLGVTGGDAVWIKSHIFRVPNTTNYSWAELFNDNPRDRIFSHLSQGIRVENLYRLSDGSYTINDPGYGRSTRQYLGGHNIFLSDEEITELTAAGYGAYIS
jgi:hypothetical protein